ncbi:MAG TPA: hypothetical protein VNS58_31020 [Puia sp.]|nr:hypothetical protein [Puia sp.]
MLCDPLPDFDNSPVLAATSVEQPLILLYVAEKDLAVIIGFYKKEVPPAKDERALLIGFKQMFQSFARSTRSQAFMVWLGGNPLFEVEIHNAKMHFPYEDTYTPGEKEYYMVLKAGAFDAAGFPIYVRGLQLCLDYFRSFSEVEGILAVVNEGPHQEQQTSLFQSAGMTRTLEITHPESAGLYYIGR